MLVIEVVFRSLPVNSVCGGVAAKGCSIMECNISGVMWNYDGQTRRKNVGLWQMYPCEINICLDMRKQQRAGYIMYNR